VVSYGSATGWWPSGHHDSVLGVAYLAVWSTTVVVLDSGRDRSYGDRYGILGRVVNYGSGT
jgi:hypothetical protein